MWIAVMVAVLATSVAQILLKVASTTRSLRLTAVTAACFGVATVSSFIALRQLPLSTVYMATGLTYVIVTLLAAVALRESIDRMTTIALVLITGGTTVFNL